MADLSAARSPDAGLAGFVRALREGTPGGLAGLLVLRAARVARFSVLIPDRFPTGSTLQSVMFQLPQLGIRREDALAALEAALCPLDLQRPALLLVAWDVRRVAPLELAFHLPGAGPAAQGAQDVDQTALVVGWRPDRGHGAG